MNTLAYMMYLLITYLVTFRVGWRLYKNGELYILPLLQGDIKTTRAINKLLLTGYYLLNLGYAAVMIQFWKDIYDWRELVESITMMTGRILLTLALIHFANMLAIYFFSRKSMHHHKKTTL